jgi:hypothetical protein
MLQRPAGVHCTQDLYDEVGRTEDIKKFLRYNAKKAQMNLGYEALLLRVRVVVCDRQGRQHRRRAPGLLKPQVRHPRSEPGSTG